MRNLMGLLLLLAICGCQNNPFGRWASAQYGQGSIERQKARAVVTDPYPLNDIGPEVVGARPREFAYPMPEAARNELTARDPYGRIGK